MEATFGAGEGGGEKGQQFIFRPSARENYKTLHVPHSHIATFQKRGAIYNQSGNVCCKRYPEHRRPAYLYNNPVQLAAAVVCCWYHISCLPWFKRPQKHTHTLKRSLPTDVTLQGILVVYRRKAEPGWEIGCNLLPVARSRVHEPIIDTIKNGVDGGRNAPYWYNSLVPVESGGERENSQDIFAISHRVPSTQASSVSPRNRKWLRSGRFLPTRALGTLAVRNCSAHPRGGREEPGKLGGGGGGQCSRSSS